MWAWRRLGYFCAITLFIMSGSYAMAQPAASPPPCTPGIPCTQYTPDTGANNSKRESDKTCDGDVMNQIHARAFLEAQRENMINQVMVRKPDSILSYTCYDQFAGVAASRAPPIFSESTRWSGMSVSTSVEGKPAGAYPATRTLNVNMGDGHIEALINGVVLGPASNFTRANFSHGYLGDTAGFGHQVEGSVQRIPNMLCNRMQAVWNTAKCQDLKADPFPGFEELATTDPRTLTGTCNNLGISNDIIAAAANKAPKYERFGQLMEPYKFVKVDGIRHTTNDTIGNYFDPKLLPMQGEGEANDCAPAIKTGVQLTERRGALSALGSLEVSVASFEDAVCPNPHCYYIQNSCVAQQ